MSTPIIQLPNTGGDPIVKLLEEALALARAGRLGSVAVITVSSIGNIGTSLAGGRPGDIYVGADMLKGQLMAAFTGGGRPPLAS